MFFNMKPKYHKEYDTWLTPSGLPTTLNGELFPDVLFLNSPQEVELIIKK